jgi:hypothetical protein
MTLSRGKPFFNTMNVFFSMIFLLHSRSFLPFLSFSVLLNSLNPDPIPPSLILDRNQFRMCVCRKLFYLDPDPPVNPAHDMGFISEFFLTQ